jgi:hypothetical protein
MKILGIAALAAGLALAGAADAANLLTNGSFENGLSGWTITNGSPSDGFSAVVINYNQAAPYPTGAFGEAVPTDTVVGGSPDAAGAHAAYFVSDFSNQIISQSVALTAGTYQVGFDAYLPANGLANGGDGTFTAMVGGVQLVSEKVTDLAGLGAGWQHFSGNIVIPSDTTADTAFQFVTNQFPSNDIVIDRVYIADAASIGGVPEPLTWALMVVGFGGVGAVLRTQRRQQFAV